MTTNFDKIKSMTVDEMAELLNDKDCTVCIYDSIDCTGDDCDCYLGIKQWLMQEVEDEK